MDDIEYGIDIEKITQQASENIKKKKEYRKLQVKLQRLSLRFDPLKYSMVQSELRELEKQEIDRLWQLEMDRRQNVQGITDLMGQIGGNEYNRWLELVVGYSFIMDMLDFVVTDINELMERNRIGMKMNKLKELEEARAMAQQMVRDNLKSMDEEKSQMWMDESDRLWGYLQTRFAVYCRKVARKEEKDTAHRHCP